MTPDEFNRWMTERSNKIGSIITPAALQLIALIKRRIISTGEKAEGGQFSAYTDAYLKKKSKRHTVSFKNFEDTRVMWNSFGIKDTEETLGMTVITARMDEDSRGSITNQGLMEVHSKAEDSELVAASTEEEKVMVEYIDRKLTELWA